MEGAEATATSAQREANLCGALKRVFGPRGVQHFVLDGVVHDLAQYTRNYLKELAPAFQLELHMQQVRHPALPFQSCYFLAVVSVTITGGGGSQVYHLQ
jgi:hypothetical protein